MPLLQTFRSTCTYFCFKFIKDMCTTIYRNWQKGQKDISTLKISSAKVYEFINFICQLRSNIIEDFCYVFWRLTCSNCVYRTKHIWKYTHVFFVFAAEASEKRLRSAIDEIIRYNNYVDRNYEHDASWHFNGEQIREGTKM